MSIGWGDTFSRVSTGCLPVMGLVSSEEDHPVSITSARPKQSRSRPGVKRGADFSKVEAP